MTRLTVASTSQRHTASSTAISIRRCRPGAGIVAAAAAAAVTAVVTAVPGTVIPEACVPGAGVTEAIVTTVPITPSDFAVTAVFCGFMCIVCFVRIALLVTARVESVSFFHLALMFMFVTIGCCLMHPMRCAGRMTGVPSKTLASAFRVMRRFCGVPVGFVLSHFEGGVES